MTLANHTPAAEAVSKKIVFKKVVLVVLDGWGIGPKDRSNPIWVAAPKSIDYIKQNFPLVSLQASGIAVGLPWQEEGNSEIGHLTLGSGRVVYQPFPRITMAIKDGSFLKNEVLLNAINYAKQNNVRLHFVGLFGEANVHSSLEHLQALIKMAVDNGVPDFRLHLITDGRDSGPETDLKLLERVPTNNISSLSGRFYSMDRDNYLDRTAAGFKAMIGEAGVEADAAGFLKKMYGEGTTDEFIRPTVIGSPDKSIKNGDAVVFFNFREERMKQLVRMMIENLPQSRFVSFVEYDASFKIPVAFPPEKIENPLGKVLSDHGLTDLRLAESEKEAHVTFFFNGQRVEPFPNEYRVIIPSRKTASHALYPEMMAEEITARATTAIEEGIYNFILINYANPDMVAHTGNFEACLKAVNAVDQSLQALISAGLKTDTPIIITADHGNMERVANPYTGEPETKHDPSPVPFYLVSEAFRQPKTSVEADEREKEVAGSLADVAPTILELMGLPKPPEMTGESLLSYLQS
ncbi:MAG: 2,3-bisphosphoglycerate-independent phosphoglycerate mutase [Patescibacteria group bacterium]|nr:2,3-bisphosphoglycerate-independent phosphoglycerate mutase [Patescibacteria group bacterium]MCL5261797.1 2,3-bisphosphoglycerate-independent phosphoglycerate mutase [Patescibacteria group bacterium]